MRQAENGQESTEHAKRAGDEKRVLSSTCGIWRVGLDDWKNVASDESADLAEGGGDAVVLSSDRSCARLRGNESDIVTWADLAKGKENTAKH